MYKSKLQEQCHGKRWGLPRYTAMKDGPDHIPCFKASVSVNGFSFDSPLACKSSKQAQNLAAMLAFLHFTSPPSSVSSLSADEHTLESPEFCKTLKEAEDAAAKAVSMSLSPDGFHNNDESGHHKNLLQELAQREGFSMPAYRTVKCGAFHMPTFSSTVAVKGEKFCGKAGKSKKQAELSAAKVAYIALKERGLSRAAELTSLHPKEGALKTTQSCNLRMTVDSLENLTHEHHLASAPAVNQYEECAIEIKGTSDNLSANFDLKAEDCNSSQVVQKMDGMSRTRKSSTGFGSILSSPEESPSSQIFVQANFHDVSVSDSNVGKRTGLKSYLLCNRVRVYTEFPDITFPNYITVLPVSDGKWVAFSLEFPNEENN